MNLVRRLFSFLAIHLYAKRKITRTDTITLLGFSLEIAPTVFHPQLYFSSKLLGEYVESLPLQGKRILDMGTGSGIIALCAARAGARVLAVDINPAAVDCARRNVRFNNLHNRIDVAESNLFAAIDRRMQFDYIFWNPPFYSKPQTTMASVSWNAGEGYTVIRKFAEGTEPYLAPAGVVVISLSSDVDVHTVFSFFRKVGLREELVKEERRLFEHSMVYQFRQE